MTQFALFAKPARPAPPPKQDTPKPAPYVPNAADVARRERLILAALSKPGTLGDILHRVNGRLAPGSPDLLTQSATVCDLSFMVRDGLLTRTAGDDPVYSRAP